MLTWTLNCLATRGRFLEGRRPEREVLGWPVCLPFHINKATRPRKFRHEASLPCLSSDPTSHPSVALQGHQDQAFRPTRSPPRKYGIKVLIPLDNTFLSIPSDQMDPIDIFNNLPFPFSYIRNKSFYPSSSSDATLSPTGNKSLTCLSTTRPTGRY